MDHLDSWLKNVAFGLGFAFEVSERGFGLACPDIRGAHDLTASRDE